MELPERRASAILRIDDGRVVIGEWGGDTLVLRDLRSGAEIRRFRGHEAPIEDVIRIDSRRLLSAADDGTLRLWDLDTGTELSRLKGSAGWVTVLAQIDDDRVVSASTDNVLRLWDLRIQEDQSLVRTEARADNVRELVTISSAHIISFDHKASAIDLWTFGDCKRKMRFECQNFQKRAAFRLSDRELVLPWYGNALPVCDLQTGARLQQIIFEHDAGDKLSLGDLDTAPILGTQFVSVLGKTLRLWDSGKGAEIRRWIGHNDEIWSVTPIAAHYFLSSSVDGTVQLWDARELKPVKTFKMPSRVKFAEEVCRVDERRALIRSRRGNLHILDLHSEEITWIGDNIARLDATALLNYHCVWGDQNGAMHVWDLQAGREIRCFHAHSDTVNALALAAGGLLSISRDCTIRLWDWQAGHELACLEGDVEFRSMATHADQFLVALLDTLERLHWVRITHSGLH